MPELPRVSGNDAIKIFEPKQLANPAACGGVSEQIKNRLYSLRSKIPRPLFGGELQKLGFKTLRQRGSHVVLRKDNKGCVIPVHKELAIGTLRSAIKQAGITLEEFIKAYKDI